jgi:valyl-tRNA synthetase
LQKAITGLERKLGNEKFVANAPEDVVEADRGLLEQSKLQIQDLRQSLTRLQG